MATITFTHYTYHKVSAPATLCHASFDKVQLKEIIVEAMGDAQKPITELEAVTAFLVKQMGADPATVTKMSEPLEKPKAKGGAKKGGGTGRKPDEGRVKLLEAIKSAVASIGSDVAVDGTQVTLTIGDASYSIKVTKHKS